MVSRSYSRDSNDSEKESDLLAGISVRTRDQTNAQKEVELFGVEDAAVIKTTRKMDGRQSFSDLVLVVKDGKQAHIIYHDHKKANLTLGERKIGLLIKLRGNIRNAQSIPFLADYIYNNKPDLNAAILPAMRRVANHFHVRTLYTLVLSFNLRALREEALSWYV